MAYMPIWSAVCRASCLGDCIDLVPETLYEAITNKGAPFRISDAGIGILAGSFMFIRKNYGTSFSNLRYEGLLNAASGVDLKVIIEQHTRREQLAS